MTAGRTETIKATQGKVKGRSVCVASPNMQLDGVCESQLFNTQVQNAQVMLLLAQELTASFKPWSSTL